MPLPAKNASHSASYGCSCSTTSGYSSTCRCKTNAASAKTHDRLSTFSTPPISTFLRLIATFLSSLVYCTRQNVLHFLPSLSFCSKTIFRRSVGKSNCCS
ncbi:unnamed protein product [Toxocara canis]|uniref:Uncharacterized protein n=1 Tax=Toxocara canis TaxID=6265 RepID=A0A3P7GM90_TOXCA|nr:unnamed protein product [Toxocara canis]